MQAKLDDLQVFISIELVRNSQILNLYGRWRPNTGQNGIYKVDKIDTTQWVFCTLEYHHRTKPKDNWSWSILLMLSAKSVVALLYTKEGIQLLAGFEGNKIAVGVTCIHPQIWPCVTQNPRTIGALFNWKLATGDDRADYLGNITSAKKKRSPSTTVHRRMEQTPALRFSGLTANQNWCKQLMIGHWKENFLLGEVPQILKSNFTENGFFQKKS